MGQNEQSSIDVADRDEPYSVWLLTQQQNTEISVLTPGRSESPSTSSSITGFGESGSAIPLHRIHQERVRATHTSSPNSPANIADYERPRSLSDSPDVRDSSETGLETQDGQTTVSQQDHVRPSDNLEAPSEDSSLIRISTVKQPVVASNWRPYALRTQFMLYFMGFALALTFSTIALLAYSASHKGLGRDDGSSTILFGWRFAPTLVAVIYTVLGTATFDDARRMEPFTQMSHPCGAPSSSSILKRPGQWWQVLWNSFKDDPRHGPVKGVLLVLVLVNIISFMLISPLSSALLQSQDVRFISNMPFNSFEISPSQPLTIAASGPVYFRTLGHTFQNLSTSAWLTDRYLVLPLWPSSRDLDLGASFLPSAEQWKANASVVSTELNCGKMSIQSATWNLTSVNKYFDSVPALQLSDSQGCEIDLAMRDEAIAHAESGGSWFAPPDYVLPVWTPPNVEPSEQYAFCNSTPNCADQQVILSSSGTWSDSDFKAIAYSCSTRFYFASMPVTVSSNGIATTVEVDGATFDARRTLLLQDVFNASHFEATFLSQNWTNMIFTVSPASAREFGGASALLAAPYGFDAAKMIVDDSLTLHAQSIKQRFLGETVLAAIGEQTPKSQMGELVTNERRVVVNLPIAVSLAVLLALSVAFMAIALMRMRQLPLNLHNDPGSVAATLKLIRSDSFWEDRLKNIQQMSGDSLGDALEDTRHFLLDGSMSTVKTVAHDPTNSNALPTQTRSWRPFALSRLGGVLFLTLLILISATIIVLFVLAHITGLYESAFTYQANILPSSSSLLAFAPYSIVPTILGVIVSLWWTNLAEVLSRLQPFVMMAQSSVPILPNLGASYVPSYPIWGTVVAFRFGHWLVACVSVGAVLTQVFTVSMSALWQREGGFSKGNVNLRRSLEPRSQAFTYLTTFSSAMGESDSAGGQILSSFYSNLSTNWLYSATLELAYNGTQPAWSRDGWSFVPVDLSPVAESHLYKRTPLSKSSQSVKQVNVSLTTPAVRATVNCTPVQSARNLSAWLTHWDFTNQSIWNTSINPQDLKRGFGINTVFEFNEDTMSGLTTMFARPKRPLCCMNTTDTEKGMSAIGYWSYNYRDVPWYDIDDSDFSTSAGQYPRNFTMKWINGQPARQLYVMNPNSLDDYSEDDPHLIWPQAPSMTALNCQPKVEMARAKITADMLTGKIWEYSIAEEPETTEWPWADGYLEHNYLGDPGNVAAVAWSYLTASYGVLFQDAMLFASDLSKVWYINKPSTTAEDLEDQQFNFRIPEQGLNADLMSWSMYQIAKGDLETLQNPQKMQEIGSKVYTTFFQHFVSNNQTEVGLGYQRINATLPAELGSINGSSYQDRNTTLTAPSDMVVSADFSIAVDVLAMSPVAVYISLSILLVLTLMMLFVFLTGYKHVRNLKHDFDDLGSVIGVVYDSPKLKRWIQEHPDPRHWSRKPAKGETVPMVRLGNFVGGGGREIWGIEIVGDESSDGRNSVDGSDVAGRVDSRTVAALQA